MAGRPGTASYLLLPGEVLVERVREAEQLLTKCSLCPRRCAVDRTREPSGYCKTGTLPFISSYGPHFGEESPLVGEKGSGTIFFSHCNLGCLFCQNYSISHLGEGREVSCETLAGIMMELQETGCCNINLVTPTHQAPAILKALVIAVDKGLHLPLVYNCGGYESLEALRLLEGIVDIYMPDMKYSNPAMGLKYSAVPDYPAIARDAVKEMHQQTGDLIIDASGVARRGLIVRHLVLPGNIAGSFDVIDFLAGEISRNTYTNIMDQYHPCFKAFDYPQLNKAITRQEYRQVIEYAKKAGLTRLDKEDLRGMLL